MPTSRFNHTADVCLILQALKPKSVLDIGVGFGRWGFLAREVCDIWEGRYFPDTWQARIDGIEPFEPYVQDWHNAIYDFIYTEPIENSLNLITGYEVIIAGDVLEHITNGLDVLGDLIKLPSKALIVGVPLGNRPQGEVYNNPYEAHRSVWSREILIEQGARVKTYGSYALAVWSEYELPVLFTD